MKIVITKNGIKRELTTPFSLAIDREELANLIRYLQHEHGGMKETDISYGWIHISDHIDRNIPCGSPRQWDTQ